MSTPPAAAAGAGTVVSPAWLADAMRDQERRVRVLDCSWYLPAMARDGIEEHAARRIPGARYFDVDAISDPTSSLPHMLPSASQFAAACDALDVRNDDQVVVYDGAGLFSAARAWWMFKAFGHDAVAVLDGGMPAWLEANLPLDETAVDDATVRAAAAAAAAAVASEDGRRAGCFQARLDKSLVRSKQDVLTRCVESAGNSATERLVDARPEPRWRGAAPEPRKGVRSGRVPGSACVPFFSLLDESKRVKSGSEIEKDVRRGGRGLEGHVHLSGGELRDGRHRVRAGARRRARCAGAPAEGTPGLRRELDRVGRRGQRMSGGDGLMTKQY
jgi:thiosulfate/3-mercaptopyruvate sulfurtransferase